ncbi:hypothetical protein XELAEV_18033476mg [Xenopus laevis]|uniref:Uncharacterized protein n=1 Tax=Xenopus laevis TaxID=8355 RepID=A0A974CKV3_XENLA|nr:hypothetical protein XELAEV_18033476mg [Xenopus laevis]
MEKCNMQKIVYDLHLCTLAEYYKLQRIPRGLRSHLRPSMFSDDMDFKNKWEAILNKCSMDIMLLMMERLQKEMPSLTAKIEDAERKTRAAVPAEQFQAVQPKLEESLRHFRLKLEARKRGKFHRDETDYTEGRVYRWTPRDGYQNRPQQGAERGPMVYGGRTDRDQPLGRDVHSTASSSPSSFLYGSQESISSDRTDGGGVGRGIVPRRPPRRRKKLRW